MIDGREVVIVDFSLGKGVEFNSRGRRVKRLVSSAELAKLRKLIEEKDYAGIDLFCQKIV